MRRPARSHHRIVLLAATLVASLLWAHPSGAAPVPATASSAGATARCRLDSILRPTCGKVLTGAYVAPRAGESWAASVQRYERESSAPAQIVHFYQRGAELFPTASEVAALDVGGRRRILYSNWKPDVGYTWRQVADGAADASIRAEATYLKRHFRRKMFLSIHHEPENEVNASRGSGYTAADYRAMFRHVEDVFDAEHVTNVVWVMNYMGFQNWVLEPWFDQLWPGRAYVDWIAYDPYLTSGIGGQDGGWPRLLDNYYGDTSFKGFFRWIRQHHPLKPVMLGEWGLGEKPGDPGWKARVLRRTAPFVAQHPRLKALVYFDNPQADAAGDVAIDTSGAALAAYRDFVGSAEVANIR